MESTNSGRISRAIIGIVGVAVIAVLIIVGLRYVAPERSTNVDKNNGTTSKTNQSSTGSAADENSNQEVAPDATKETIIEIRKFAFQPSLITVKTGTVITWKNLDTTSHTVTGKDINGLDSGILKKDDSYTYTFKKAGQFNYFCKLHPEMTGAVQVVE